jgi:hypothetical protein
VTLQNQLLTPDLKQLLETRDEEWRVKTLILDNRHPTIVLERCRKKELRQPEQQRSSAETGTSSFSIDDWLSSVSDKVIEFLGVDDSGANQPQISTCTSTEEQAETTPSFGIGKGGKTIKKDHIDEIIDYVARNHSNSVLEYLTQPLLTTSKNFRLNSKNPFNMKVYLKNCEILFTFEKPAHKPLTLHYLDILILLSHVTAPIHSGIWVPEGFHTFTNKFNYIDCPMYCMKRNSGALDICVSDFFKHQERTWEVDDGRYARLWTFTKQDLNSLLQYMTCSEMEAHIAELKKFRPLFTSVNIAIARFLVKRKFTKQYHTTSSDIEQALTDELVLNYSNFASCVWANFQGSMLEYNINNNPILISKVKSAIGNDTEDIIQFNTIMLHCLCTQRQTIGHLVMNLINTDCHHFYTCGHCWYPLCDTTTCMPDY